MPINTDSPGEGFNLAVRDAVASGIIPFVDGKPICCVTAYRWIKVGCLNYRGQKVRLRGRKLGSRWYTSREAIDEFSQALTPPFQEDELPRGRTESQTQRASDRAAKLLEAAGI